MGVGGSTEGMSTASASRFLLEAQVLHTVVRLCVVMKGGGKKSEQATNNRKCSQTVQTLSVDLDDCSSEPAGILTSTEQVNTH